MNIQIQHYMHEEIHINIPTHYNKYELIRNAHKYDISKCVYKFLMYKIKSNELIFTVDGINCVQYMEENPEKSKYTILIGNLIKIDRRIYTEYLHSSINFLENLVMANKLYIPEIKIYKVYVDEIITSKKLIILDLPNKYNYTVAGDKINVFVKKLETLKKQLYVTPFELIVNHTFMNKENLVTDLNNINCNTYTEKDCIFELEHLSNSIIDGSYDINKLLEEYNGNNLIKTINSENKVQYTKFIKYEYDPLHYYEIFKEIAKYILMAKQKV